jgi:hypothetical protein
MEIFVLGWNQTKMRLIIYPILMNTEIAKKYPSDSDDYPFQEQIKKKIRTGNLFLSLFLKA